jgi:hypothetical protein
MDVRFATFNTSLSRGVEGQLLADLSTPDDAQARAVAEIIQRTYPDVLLLNEFDHIEDGAAVQLFRTNYLAVSQNGADPLDYPYSFIAPSNTGIQTGHDLDGDGLVGGPDDAFGFGLFPGQYGMAVLSRHPIDAGAVRTFQHFLWKDMPGNLMPPGFYPPEAEAILRLSSKSHWDVPIAVGDHRVHFLVSHPTPPVFDGPEGRNRRRNSDEIRFWSDYLDPERSGYLHDDKGGRAGLAPEVPFVIAGDLNSDPFDGMSEHATISALLDDPRVNASVTPSSEGAAEAGRPRDEAEESWQGNPADATAHFAELAGTLRVDYVLPSRDLLIVDAGVFWPASTDPLHRLIGTFPFASSDHRLVWVDVRLPDHG